jgi:hypothetical protein
MRDDLATWAAAHLTAPRITLPPIDAARVSRAVATNGTGPDHLVGEEVLALADESPGAGAFTLGVLVTDARLVVRAAGRTVVVAFAALETAEALEGLVTTGLRLRWSGAEARWPFSVETSRALAAFVNAIVEAPADTRTPAPVPLVQPSVLDSSGLAGVRAGLRSLDPRPPLLADLALDGQQRGALSTDLARDFGARIALYDRTLAFGRGAHDTWWLSPLGGPDLLHALAAIVGAPAATADLAGVRTVDFRGSGWGGLVRVRVSPSSGFTAFTTEGDGGRPLAEGAPERLRPILDALVPIEGRGLARRLVAGWGPVPESLAALPVATLEAKLRETVGPVDFAAVFGLPPA